MPLINRLQSNFNVWYMDDGTIGDHADVLLNDFQLLIAGGKNLGLTVNTAKCELIIDDESVLEKFRTVAPDVRTFCRQMQCCSVLQLAVKAALTVD